MNYFKGYKKGKRKNHSELVGLVGGYTKGALALSIGSQVVSQPQFGAIGQQGAQGLSIAGGFLPTIATIGVGGYAVRQVRKLGKKARSRQLK